MKWWHYGLISSSLFLWGCPQEFPIVNVTAPPTVLPTPSPTPSPIAPPPCSSTASCATLALLPPLTGDFYRLEFGPGSKGFGFGPGSKGFPNVAFQMNFAPTLVRRDIAPFQTQQTPTRLELLELEIIRDNEWVATAQVKPATTQIRFESYLAPGPYTLRSAAKGNFPSLVMSNGQLEVLDGYHAEIRVVLHDRQADPATLDIEILTRNRLVKAK